MGGHRGRGVEKMTEIEWIRGFKTKEKTKVKNDDSNYVRKALINQLTNNWLGFGRDNDMIRITTHKETGK